MECLINLLDSGLYQEEYQEEMDSKLDFEGAGMLLLYNGTVIFGDRIKGERDLKRDPIREMMCLGGGVEEEDNGDPYTTGFNELHEEAGQKILDEDWRSRVTPLETLQERSGKLMWCFIVNLTETEYGRIVAADKALDSWGPSETRVIPEDEKKDPVPEVEFMAGVPNEEDKNDPFQTGFAKFTEELGGPVLDADWRSRVTPIHTFQPFHKKWIWCLLVRLTKAEYEKIVEIDKSHDTWSADVTRDLSSITGRSTPVKKVMSGFVEVPKEELVKYITGFTKVPKSENRMSDAKAYRTTETMSFTRLSTGEEGQRSLRSYNAVVIEDHVDMISQTVK